ncbi:hypothetical protein ACJJTC_000594 [Scirpophaga incertulas]
MRFSRATHPLKELASVCPHYSDPDRRARYSTPLYGLAFRTSHFVSFKMRCLKTVLMTLFVIILIELKLSKAELKLREEMQALAEEMKLMKNKHQVEVARLQKEVAELKHQAVVRSTDNHERNEHTTLEWAKTSMNEIRLEMKELTASVNNSELLHQLHVIRNQLKQALTETTDLAQFARTQEARIDKLDNEAGRLKHEGQQLRGMMAGLRTEFGKLSKELKSLQLQEQYNDDANDIHYQSRRGEPREHIHKFRHNKMVHTQISRLARTQEQLEEFQQSLQTQLLDVQRRMDRFEEPNWNLMTTKMDFLEVEHKAFKVLLKNTSDKVADIDKIHSSILELREDLENIENKADKTIPEFRKEISKLDVNYAQLNAQASYLKEDQENLRQSVKAIAVSVSNTIDRAEVDRITIKKLNTSVASLETRAKEHFFRLNDHILKSEVNHSMRNETDITLPELISDVKDLQPIEREYEDLVSQLPRDCSTIEGPPGVYLIHPGQTPFETWCSNGSTLIQRRSNGSIEFNLKFADYVHGFGHPASEYWLGLESMHKITVGNCSSMRIDMTDIYGASWYAEYENFYVGGAETGYVLEVSGFKGNAGDAFEYQNHMEFSAIDRDRDISNTHCAGNYEGGWWYSHCQHVNINGKYNLGLTWFDTFKNEWIAVATSELRTFRRPNCL